MTIFDEIYMSRHQHLFLNYLGRIMYTNFRKLFGYVFRVRCRKIFFSISKNSNFGDGNKSVSNSTVYL